MLRSTDFYLDFDDATVSPALSNDCDCACPVSLPVAPMPQHAHTSLRPHPDLRRIALDHEHWVAFVPSFSRVAVVDAAAWSLLQAPSAAPAGDPRAAQALAVAHKLGLLMSADEQPSAPPRGEALVAWLHITNACNLRCSYCYLEKTSASMSTETGRAVVDATLRSAVAGSFRRVELKYAGGEATLSLHRVAEIHRYALARGAELNIPITARILSNGTTLTPGRLALIRELGVGLMVSLDGLGRNHDEQRATASGSGSSAAVMQGLRRALDYDLRVTVSVTVTPKSIEGLPDLIEELLDLQLPFSINFVRPSHGDHETIARAEKRIIAGMRATYGAIAKRPPRYSLLGSLLDRANLGVSHRRTCGVGENYLVFDQDGKVARCHMLIDQPVTTMDAPDPLARICADETGASNLTVDEKEGCQECEWRYWCAGGCSVATYRATGRYDVRSPNCLIYKTLYPELLRLEGLRLLARQG